MMQFSSIAYQEEMLDELKGIQEELLRLLHQARDSSARFTRNGEALE